ncbi:MAG: GntR family transcriptional regulator [Steroidobacteraceae bacterium]
MPFYFQLARVFQEEIGSGNWAPGHRLASESAICDHYRVARSTVRQALLMLENEGLIRREKGRGTFVAGSQPRSWLLQSPEGLFYEEVQRLGRQVDSTILRAEREPLPRWAADALNLTTGTQGVALERLRRVDGQVVIYVVNHLPDAFAETVLALDADASMYDAIERAHGARVAGGHRSVEAVTAGPRLAIMLECEPATPVAFIESVSWDADLRPFDCYRAWLRTDRLRIEIVATESRKSAR